MMHVHPSHFGYRALRWSAVLALIALGLMVWGVVVPSPISLVIAMSIGQVFGTLSFAVFLVVVVNDLRRARVFSDEPGSISNAPPSAPPDKQP
jgi:hypothetical protein